MNDFILPYEHAFVVNGITCMSRSLINHEEFEARLTSSELKEMIFNNDRSIDHE